MAGVASGRRRSGSYKLASRWSTCPKGDFPLCDLLFGSFRKLIFNIQFAEPNLEVLFCCLCLALFLQSIQQLKVTMERSLRLWLLQVAGVFSLRFTIVCVSFKDGTSSIHSTFA